ncbi:hypothetical protein [Limosilactobacillus ingluviei]|uniref:hypothetical protein n=1 Tax=Limosilactobacillus ingluviei TaxID=148604 RepID=UPI0007053E1E|nr:hypothetical protein [Limosilactobacillus ingluviei]
MVSRQMAISQSFKNLSEKFSLVKSHDVKFGTAKTILSSVGFTPERQAFWKYEITRDNQDLVSQYDTDGHGSMKYNALYLLYRVLYCEREYGDKFMLVHDGRWSDNFKSASQINKMLTHPYKDVGGGNKFTKKTWVLASCGNY